MDSNPAMPQLLYMDMRLLVISKPWNLLSTAGEQEDQQDCVISRLEEDFPDASAVSALGFSASGVMILALDPDTQHKLRKSFEAGEVDVSWQAILTPAPTEKNGTIATPDGRSIQWQQINSELSEDQANSRVRIQNQSNDSDVLCTLLSNAGMQVASDNPPPGADAGEPRLLLHAQTLSFKHPLTGLPMNFESPCPF